MTATRKYTGKLIGTVWTDAQGHTWKCVEMASVGRYRIVRYRQGVTVGSPSDVVRIGEQTALSLRAEIARANSYIPGK